MATNEFLPFAAAGGANVQDQAAYAASTERTDGYSDGEAPEAAGFNKAVRQSAAITSVVAQAICDITGRDMLDDADTAAQLAAFKAMLQQASQIGYLVDTGAVNAYVITPNPAIGAYVGGQTFFMVPANTNNAAASVNVNGLGAKAIVHSDGSAVKIGDIPAGGGVQLIYSAALGKFILNSVTTQWGSGWFRVPGTATIVQYTHWTCALSSAVGVPSPMHWGSVTVNFPITFPSGVNALVGGNEVNTDTTAATCSFINNSASSCSVIAADTTTTLTANGWLIAIGS